MKIGQSKKHSWLEAIFNTVVGYVVAIISQEIIFPLFGVVLPLHTHMLVGGCFTIVSVIRSYLLRRAFNWWHMRETALIKTLYPTVSGHWSGVKND